MHNILPVPVILVVTPLPLPSFFWVKSPLIDRAAFIVKVTVDVLVPIISVAILIAPDTVG